MSTCSSIIGGAPILGGDRPFFYAFAGALRLMEVLSLLGPCNSLPDGPALELGPHPGFAAGYPITRMYRRHFNPQWSNIRP